MILLIRHDLCFYDQTNEYNLMNIESFQYKTSLAIIKIDDGFKNCIFYRIVYLKYLFDSISLNSNLYQTRNSDTL